MNLNLTFKFTLHHSRNVGAIGIFSFFHTNGLSCRKKTDKFYWTSCRRDVLNTQTCLAKVNFWLQARILKNRFRKYGINVNCCPCRVTQICLENMFFFSYNLKTIKYDNWYQFKLFQTLNWFLFPLLFIVINKMETALNLKHSWQ